MQVYLFTNVRDETHLPEWIEHHLSIGFSHIHIFDHLSQLPVATVLQQRGYPSSLVTSERISPTFVHGTQGIKMPLMHRASQIARQSHAHWMLYLDADEFLVLDWSIYPGVRALLHRYHYVADSLGINWLMFGSNHRVELLGPNESMIDAYTSCEQVLNHHVKSFVKPGVTQYPINPHFYPIRTGMRRMWSVFGPMNKDNPTKSMDSCAFNTNLPKLPPLGSIPSNTFCPPAFIAHYIIQSEKRYRYRKEQLPRDDTGTFRSTITSDAIHNMYNDCTCPWSIRRPIKTITPSEPKPKPEPDPEPIQNE